MHHTERDALIKAANQRHAVRIAALPKDENLVRNRNILQLAWKQEVEAIEAVYGAISRVAARKFMLARGEAYSA